MGAGEQIPSLLLEKELSACRDRALLFLTDLEFLAEPREAAAMAFTPVPSTGAAFAAALCIPAAMLPLEGGLSPAPPGPLRWQNPQPHPSWDFPLHWGAGRWGKSLASCFPPRSSSGTSRQQRMLKL